MARAVLMVRKASSNALTPFLRRWMRSFFVDRVKIGQHGWVTFVAMYQCLEMGGDGKCVHSVGPQGLGCAARCGDDCGHV